ncbi:universal stress protein [Propionivibrio dicarboxylicus]|uniref:Nucleotide-binding universal stress protein, UspA family n=1 Tax=Propionivibrio dicarboxylicus TaxID=83767 RepID=A0A1G8GZ13_9RHOO|nr:universal stress protein [Propionivibrio dicarboxylicus]SDH99665.1 Nucleotide-binding universal stress protein, UspA family [Propionivibrio dicarboxylicus]
MFKHLLVPTDGSPLSCDAVEHAIAFAHDADARITFFHAEQRLPALYVDMGAIGDPQMLHRFHQGEDSIAQEILGDAERRATAAGVACASLTMTCDAPSEAIVEAVQRQGCDLIFMASHGHRGIGALLLGSETQNVLAHSRIPVLVYRRPDELMCRSADATTSP